MRHPLADPRGVARARTNSAICRCGPRRSPSARGRSCGSPARGRAATAQRRRRTDKQRAARRRPGGGRTRQPGDRARALREPQDRRKAPHRRHFSSRWSRCSWRSPPSRPRSPRPAGPSRSTSPARTRTSTATRRPAGGLFSVPADDLRPWRDLRPVEVAAAGSTALVTWRQADRIRAAVAAGSGAFEMQNPVSVPGQKGDYRQPAVAPSGAAVVAWRRYPDRAGRRRARAAHLMGGSRPTDRGRGRPRGRPGRNGGRTGPSSPRARRRGSRPACTGARG